MRNLIICTAILLVVFLAGSAFAVDPNLVAWYTFDEGSGTTATDWANGHNGTINGATWVAGKKGGALSFDGINDYVRVLDNPAVRFTQDSSFTLCSWINPISTVGQGVLLGKFQTSGMDNLFTYNMDWWLESQGIGFQAAESGYSYVNLGTPGGVAPVDTWSHIACVYDNRNMKIYVNGELEATDISPMRQAPTRQTMTLGIGAALIGSSVERYFNGSLDDIRIYNRALTGEEIKSIPEPATIALLGLGIMALRRKRKS